MTSATRPSTAATACSTWAGGIGTAEVRDGNSSARAAPAASSPAVSMAPQRMVGPPQSGSAKATTSSLTFGVRIELPPAKMR